MTDQAASEFACEWIEAWNAHDLGRVLAHYDDDFEMSSPFIEALAGEAAASDPHGELAAALTNNSPMTSEDWPLRAFYIDTVPLEIARDL